MSKEACGCGQAVGTEITLLEGLKRIGPLKGKEWDEASEYMKSSLAGIRDVLKSQAGQWLFTVKADCGVDTDPILDSIRADEFEAAESLLLDTLERCRKV